MDHKVCFQRLAGSVLNVENGTWFLFQRGSVFNVTTEQAISMVVDIGHLAISPTTVRQNAAQCDGATKRCIVRHNSLSHCAAFCRTVEGEMSYINHHIFPRGAHNMK